MTNPQQIELPTHIFYAHKNVLAIEERLHLYVLDAYHRRQEHHSNRHTVRLYTTEKITRYTGVLLLQTPTENFQTENMFDIPRIEIRGRVNK